LTHTLTRGGTNTPALQVPVPQAPGGQERRPEQHLVTALAPEHSEQPEQFLVTPSVNDIEKQYKCTDGTIR